MEAYAHLSKMYDYLMDDIDYDQWVDYLDKFIKKHYSNAERILELACGTGNITMRLAERGYRVDAVDISDEMLTIAQGKVANKMGKVRFIQSDMLELDLNERYDVVLCLCDGINYITEMKNVDILFAKVADVLKESGVFIFDISSEHKLSDHLGNHTFAENYDDFSYIWENYYDYEQRLLEFDFTIFQKEGDLFRKYQEYHIQRAHQVGELSESLAEKGFENLGIYHEMTLRKYVDDSERIHFVTKYGGNKN